MGTRLLLIAHMALSFIIFTHCHGDTPPDYSEDSDDTSKYTDSESQLETDSVETDSDSTTATDTDSVTDTDEDTDKDTDTDTETDTGEETDTVNSTPWWNCEYPERREIDISGVSKIEPKHALYIVFDHKSLVTNNLSNPDGSDIRILHWNAVSYDELPRVVDPNSSWNLEDTKIWFSFDKSAFLATGAEKVYVYYGDLTPKNPHDKETEVFHFADFFERNDGSNLGNHWEEFSTPGTDVEIKDNAMYFGTTNDESNRPGADQPLDPLSTSFTFRFGFDWSLSESQTHYRLHIQLGNLLQMEPIPLNDDWDWFSNAGAGPSLLWSGTTDGMTHNQGFGYEVAGAVSEVAVIEGEATIQGEVNVATKTYSLFIDSGTPALNIPFSSAIDTIDTLRIFTWSIDTGTTSTSSFKYIIINKIGPAVPTANVSTDSSTGDYGDLCSI